MALSHRLSTILKLAGGSNILADIGTDHAFLPIECCIAGLCNRAIACDINKGPLKTAAANIKAAGLCDRIETRLGDGLAPLNLNEADCIVISGMGGGRIWNILLDEPDKARYAKRIILQPQHDLEELRKNLHCNGYDITDEKLVAEDERFYVILVVSYSGDVKTWADEEYFYGKYLMGSEHFLQYLSYHKDKIARYIKSVSDSEARQLAEMRLNWIKKGLSR